MKKWTFCVFICMLLFASAMFPIIAASYQQKTQTNDFETVRRGFFIGYFVSITWEEDRCIITMDNRDPPYPFPIMYVIPFKYNQLAAFEQIQLINPKYCIIQDHFIIGFSKMLFPKSTISMHVISHIDEFNTVKWVIDNIEGDYVWGSNLRAYLFYQNGTRYTGGLSSPYPWKPAYLNIGDEFQIIAGKDGIFQMKLFDTITGRVLFTSPFIHF